MRNLKLGIATLAVVGSVLPSAAEIYPRASTPDGSVISRKSGEEVRFIDISNWRSVEVNQDLLAGDTLRTNANGQLAILFADRTQMRMGRNTTLLVKKIDGSANSEFELKSGVLWGRAGRGGSGLTIETPAAAAAIRGTDWNLRVGGNGETTLSVLEGTVELYNAQGSVTVNQGEGAYAAIGQAPRKYILVDLEEREQILLYGELRDAFATLPISGLGTTQARAERLRILEKSPDTRTPEDWVGLAEVALGEEGRAAARDALAQLRRPLPSPLEARAKLVEAMIAGQELRYAEAARLFAEAAPGLPRNRQAAAAYGRWFAESLADPDGHATPPSESAYGDDPTAALARAIAVFFTRGQIEAIEILRQAEKRFPEDARLPAMRADLAFQLDRREEVQEALARARAIDPDDASSLLISARYRTSVSSDLDGALKELTRAAEVAPGSDAVWNEIGLVQSERNAIVEADAAHRLAISLNPESAVLRANYARFLLDNDQVKAAKAEIDIAESLDPQSYAVLAAKGRYLLRIGKTTEGEQVLLEASAVNPTYGDSLIGLAIASYQLGSDAEATQALDNADRFDRDNPSIPLIRAGIAMDQYRADDAIIQAREALRRREARGGFYSGFDANRQANSYLGVTLDNLGLSEWGQYYATRSRDLFKSSTYLDEAADGRVSPFIGYYPLLSPDQRIQGGSGTVSSVMQGRILDPLFVASETRRNSLETRSFFEGGIGGGFNSIGGETGWFSDILLQGTNYSTVPLSYYFQGVTSQPQSDRTNDENNLEGAVFELGMRPSLTDGIFLFANTRNVERGFPGQSDFPTPFDERTTKVREAGGAWNHVISDENVIQAFAVASKTRTDQSIYMEDSYGPFMLEQSFRDKNFTYGVSHLFGIGPLTARYGAEGSRFDSDVSQYSWDLIRYFSFDPLEFSSDGDAARLYANVTWDVSKDLQFEGGAYATWIDNGDISRKVDPRIGVAWAPIENHWLRAYYRQDTQMPTNYTLSPISTVGLAPLDLSLFIGGQTETAAVRWDAEWSERFFTAVEYQHQTFDGVTMEIPGLLGSFDTITGKIDRFSISANYWIGGGLGAFGTMSWNDSEDTTPVTGGDFGVPLIPDYVGQVGFTYVSEARWKATVAQTFVGPRVGAQFGIEIDDYNTTDIAFGWKSDSGHLEAGLQLLNAFDNDFEVAYGIPGPGRTILGTIRAKF